VILVAGLDERLLRAATAGDDADSGATLRIEALDLTAGSWTTAALRSWVIRSALVPEARANRPPSPGFDSTLQTGTPSGTSASGSVLPGLISAVTPTASSSPTVMPSGARMRR